MNLLNPASQGDRPFDRTSNEALVIILSYLDPVTVQRCRYLSRRFNAVFKKNLEFMKLPQFSAEIQLQPVLSQHRGIRVIDIDVNGKISDCNYAFSLYCMEQEAQTFFLCEAFNEYGTFSTFYRKRGTERFRLIHGDFVYFLDHTIKTGSIEESLETHLEFLTQFYTEFKIYYPSCRRPTMTYENFIQAFTEIVDRRKFRIAKIYLCSNSVNEVSRREVVRDCVNVLYSNRCRDFEIMEFGAPDDILKIVMNPFEHEQEADDLSSLRKILQLWNNGKLGVQFIQFTPDGRGQLETLVITDRNTASVCTARLNVIYRADSPPDYVLQLVNILSKQMGIRNFIIDEMCGFNWIFSTPIEEFCIHSRSCLSKDTIVKMLKMWKRGTIRIRSMRYMNNINDFNIGDLLELNATVDFINETSCFLNATLTKSVGIERLNIVMDWDHSGTCWTVLTSSRVPEAFWQNQRARNRGKWYYEALTHTRMGTRL